MPNSTHNNLGSKNISTSKLSFLSIVSTKTLQMEGELLQEIPIFVILKTNLHKAIIALSRQRILLHVLSSTYASLIKLIDSVKRAASVKFARMTFFALESLARGKKSKN